MTQCGVRAQYYKHHSGICVLSPQHAGDHLIEVVSVDTKKTNYTKPDRRPSLVQLHDFQQKAVDQMHNGCVLWGDVGGGKSITSLAYFIQKVCGGTHPGKRTVRAPKDIYVITTAKKRDSLDWEEEAAKFAIGKDREISISGIQLTVDSWNNLGKYREVKDAFFVFDEQRAVGSGKWSKHFVSIALANEWIMLSATPGDTWMDYIPLFIANGWYKNRSSFKQRHVEYAPYVKFPKVLRYHDVGRLVRLRNHLLVEMPVPRHTKRHHHTIPVNHDHELLMKVVKHRWHVYEDRPLKDVSELLSVMKRVVFTDESRLRAIRTLMQTHPRLIVFYQGNPELEMLRTLATTAGCRVSESPTASSTSGPPKTEKTSSSSKASRSTSAESTSTGIRTSSSSSTVRGLENLPPPKTFSTASEPSRSDARTTTETSSELATPRSNEAGEASHSETESLSSTTGTPSGSRTPTASRTSPSSTSTTTDPSTSTSGSEQQSEATPSSSTRSTSSTEQQSKPAPNTRTESSSTTGSGLIDSSTVPSRSGKPTSKDSPARTSPTSLTATAGTTSSPPKSSEITSDFAIAEWNGHKHEPIPTTERWVYLVQYQAGAEGWNCTSTDAMAFFTLTYSYRQWYQCHGRIDRLNTPYTDLNYYKLVSDTWLDRAMWEALNDKRDFNAVMEVAAFLKKGENSFVE